MKGVQCYELFGGIALTNDAFFCVIENFAHKKARKVLIKQLCDVFHSFLERILLRTFKIH